MCMARVPDSQKSNDFLDQSRRKTSNKALLKFYLRLFLYLDFRVNAEDLII